MTFKFLNVVLRVVARSRFSNSSSTIELTRGVGAKTTVFPSMVGTSPNTLVNDSSTIF